MQSGFGLPSGGPPSVHLYTGASHLSVTMETLKSVTIREPTRDACTVLARSNARLTAHSVRVPGWVPRD